MWRIRQWVLQENSPLCSIHDGSAGDRLAEGFDERSLPGRGRRSPKHRARGDRQGVGGPGGDADVVHAGRGGDERNVHYREGKGGPSREGGVREPATHGLPHSVVAATLQRARVRKMRTHPLRAAHERLLLYSSPAACAGGLSRWMTRPPENLTHLNWSAIRYCQTVMSDPALIRVGPPRISRTSLGRMPCSTDERRRQRSWRVLARHCSANAPRRA